ncbi:hypothetical protein OIU79_004310 [Salix purpurea]|uniref:Uncharacterized protein n=1 Tax=Salix purpurea TaxID=77065 RepID=A0A9Q0U9U5_SALPP|nr:hypothetical protein OIU79_004310 [Salix purpurea]
MSVACWQFQDGADSACSTWMRKSGCMGAAYYCDLETKNICMIHVPELKSVKLPCGDVGKPFDVVLTVHAENLLSLTSNAYEHAGKKG